jgi:hypothetical protein
MQVQSITWQARETWGKKGCVCGCVCLCVGRKGGDATWQPYEVERRSWQLREEEFGVEDLTVIVEELDLERLLG